MLLFLQKKKSLLLLALAVWTLARGFRPVFQTDELYFWLNTYGDGPVRRGLVGTLLSPVLSGAGPDQVHLVAATCQFASVAGLLVMLGADVLASAVAAPMGALFATAPFLGLLAHNVGYPDGLIALVVCWGARAMRRAGPFGAAALLLGACLLHELAFLLLLPVAAFVAVQRGDWRARDFGVLAAGVVCAGVVTLAAGAGDDHALIARLVQAGLAPDDARRQVAVSLHQHVGAALLKMIGVWRAHPVNGLAGLVYAGLPGMAIAGLGAPSVLAEARRRWEGGVARVAFMVTYAAACLGAFGLLTLAWDLSRLASFTTLTAALTTARRTQVGVAPRAIAWACAACFACVPVCNLYFDYGQPLNLTMLGRTCPACASAGRAGIDWFNRGLTLPGRERIDSDWEYGNRGMP